MGASQGVPARRARIAQEAHPLLIQITEGQSQPKDIPDVRDVPGVVNQIGRTTEVKMKNLWS